MFQSTKEELTDSVRTFKRQALIYSFLGLETSPALHLPTIDLDRMDLSEKIQVCNIILELMEFREMLPKSFQDYLYSLRLFIRAYKKARFGKGVAHGTH